MSSSRLPLPWRALREVLGGDLLPGVYALTGPVGAGKTQFALQIAAGAAEAELPVVLTTPQIDLRELGARLEGIRTRTSWPALYEQSIQLPASIRISDDLAGARFIVIDHSALEDPLGAARSAALEHQASVLVVLEPSNPEAVKSFVPPEVLRRSPAEIAAWTGVSPQVAAGVDCLMVLAPDRPRSHEGWMTIEVAVAKQRRGLPGRAALRFNGSWFEDEADDLDLGI